MYNMSTPKSYDSDNLYICRDLLRCLASFSFDAEDESSYSRLDMMYQSVYQEILR